VTIELRAGDMREVIASIAPDTVDCIVTDPPYGETSLEWDRWVDNWPSIVRPVLKRTGSMWVFGSSRMFHEHATEFAGWKFVQDIQWEKQNGTGFHADRFKRVHESAWQFRRDDSVWDEVYKDPQYSNDATARVTRRKTRPTHMGHIEASAYVSEDGGPRLMRSVIYCRNEHGRAIHPTQKPIGIVEPLVLYSCPPDGMLLDCFGGSGTVAVVAKRHGRNALLIEGDPAYVAAARHRLTDDSPLLQEAI